MSSLNALRVRDLIRAVRKCQSPSEEKALINTERARITAEMLKDSSIYNLSVNMFKLIYISMLGYSTSAGELQILQLLAHKNYSGIRTAYLALCTMAEDTDEVLTLVENHVRADLCSKDTQFTIAALTAVGNFGNEGMCRDLVDPVLRLVPCVHPPLANKLYLCSLHMVRRVPEFAPLFLEKIQVCFQGNYSLSLLSSLALVNHCLQTPEGVSFVPVYRRFAPVAIDILHSLSKRTIRVGCEVGGVEHPFLQVKILEFLRIIAQDDIDTSSMLFQVLGDGIKTSGKERNVSCAIQYECAKTIAAIENTPKLRSIGIKALGGILSVRFDNFRYVALECLKSYAAKDLSELQSLDYSRLILDCMKSPDPSIELKGIDLLVKMIHPKNIEKITPDLLEFMCVSTGEIKQFTVEHLCHLIATKSPTEEWRIDASLSLLHLGKKDIPMRFAHEFLFLISRQREEIRRMAVISLWEVLSPFSTATGGGERGEASAGEPKRIPPSYALLNEREAQMMCALWCIGEYTDALVQSKHATMKEIVSVIQGLILCSESTRMKRYGLTALMKMASRHPETVPLVTSAFDRFLIASDLILQGWTKEFSTFLTEMKEEAEVCFAPMPPRTMDREEGADFSSFSSTTPPALFDERASAVTTRETVPEKGENTLLDALFAPAVDSSSAPSPTHVERWTAPLSLHSPTQHVDPLEDIFRSVPLDRHDDGVEVAPVKNTTGDDLTCWFQSGGQMDGGGEVEGK